MKRKQRHNDFVWPFSFYNHSTSLLSWYIEKWCKPQRAAPYYYRLNLSNTINIIIISESIWCNQGCVKAYVKSIRLLSQRRRISLKPIHHHTYLLWGSVGPLHPWFLIHLFYCCFFFDAMRRYKESILFS